MKRNALILACLLIAAIGIVPACLANNNLFLPGDAFFPTELTKEELAKLQTAKTGERKFSYSSFGGYEGAFCGYAGYLNAIVPAVDDGFAKNLALIYQKIRESEFRELYERIEDGTRQLIETNGIRVLLYPPEFQFPRHVLGLRYNENWAEECVKFGHRRADVRLCCLIPNPKAVALSWRDADLVPALDARLPDVPLEPVPATEAPVVIQGPIKAIVIGSHTLEELFDHDDDEYLAVYVVDAKGITELVHADGKWEQRDFE